MSEETQEERVEPLFYDEFFRKKPKKHTGEWKIINAPCFSAPLADTHAHLDMMPDPALALARAGAHGIGFVEAMVDPTDAEGAVTYHELDRWIAEAQVLIRTMSTRICGQGWNHTPKIRIAVGVHPHNAKHWSDAVERQLMTLLTDERTSAVGEIGLDYHYDMSPRAVQLTVFEKQLEIASTCGLPVCLHVREAFDDAFEVLERVGFSSAGTLLHCYTSDSAEIARWVEAGCYVAFGGAATFPKSQDIRDAMKLVPREKLLFETDAPFMTPVPLRGCRCEPAHVIWTAKHASDELLGFSAETTALEGQGCATLSPWDEASKQRNELFEQVYENALGLLDRDPTAWQREHGESAAFDAPGTVLDSAPGV